MKIDRVHLNGFRNFSDSSINFNGNSLIMGANDVGKTNLIHAIRILLDKSLSDSDLEPKDTDFHIDSSGQQVNDFTITIFFNEVVEDSAKATLKGYIDENDQSVFQFTASQNGEYQIKVGASLQELEEVQSRF